MKYLNVFAVAIVLTFGCNAQKETVSSVNKQRPQQGERKERPSTDEVFKMDTNNDGKLSKDEVQGRLAKGFSRIDANGDGFITRTEFENAPKPQKGQRPPRN